MRRSVFAWLVLAVPAAALADPPRRCVDTQFIPSENLQIVAWIEDSAGTYVDTVYITQQTGTYGLGNRPGRYDFNSGPQWPYGRRITTFPVWSHRHGMSFPEVIFQSSPDDPRECDPMGPNYTGCGENNLSHAFSESSRENHFCRPRIEHEPGWDAATCASQSFTDKGRFSPVRSTGYPPRTDVIRNLTNDAPAVDLYKAMNPFDAVSQATPPGGVIAHAPWPVPATLPDGNYVLWVEASRESDSNASYNSTIYPAPNGISWNAYGVPYRAQPSVVYKVPFVIDTTETAATAASYAGYGDPNGQDGAVRPPDSTITIDTPGSGASRLQLLSDGGAMYRVRVTARPDSGFVSPGIPSGLAPTTVGSGSMSLTFIAPGIGDVNTKVAGYELRIRANSEITEDNFASSMPVNKNLTPVPPGMQQTLDLDALLPETPYWIGIRAYDGCHNTGPLAVVQVVTAARIGGEVNACFVATAAYGSIMANDVEMLRRFRDVMMRSSVLGELAIETYYTFGPAVAGVIGESELLRATARDVLRPFVSWVRALSF